MTLTDLTHQSVLDAIAEHDRIGRDAFLAKYHFGRARSYMVELDGRRYDSKAIAGAAHGHATGRPLPAADFSGGADTVQRKLEDLGFRVIVTTNPAWHRKKSSSPAT